MLLKNKQNKDIIKASKSKNPIKNSNKSKTNPKKEETIKKP